jgi:uncharacterized membrane protein (DUF4010 family)
VASLFSVAVAARLWPVIGASVAVCLAGAWILARPEKSDRTPSSYMTIESPLDLRAVARFALLLSPLTIAANFVSSAFGSYGLDVFAATAGLLDVDAVTLAVGRLLSSGLATEAAVGAILIGILANQTFKLTATMLGGRSGFIPRFAAVVVLAAAAGAAVYVAAPLAYAVSAGAR